MKRFSWFIAILTVLTLVLAACANNDNNGAADGNSNNNTEDLAYEPEDIDPDTDVCEICGMAIADDEHATQIILENDRSLKFDDIGDLFVWLEENGEADVGAKFVRDFNTEEWILLEDASFVYDEEIDTPMGFGVISFNDKDEAESYIEENGLGELLSATDLDDHDWEMDHDDHDHDDHDHDDHDHNDDE